jgi:hypothetical protein
MKIYYRISDTGYPKQKLSIINNENCLRNFCEVFQRHIDDIHIIADNVSEQTYEMICKYVDKKLVQRVSVGHGAGTFNLTLDAALELGDNEIVYFVENDYLHRPGSDVILQEAFAIGSEFATLYDHPDKYQDPIDGGNPYCEGGAEDTRVYLSKSCHWKLTNSTTMTFAAKVKSLRTYLDIIKHHTKTRHPHDFEMWIDMRKAGATLLSSIPGYSTHGDLGTITPLADWDGLVKG